MEQGTSLAGVVSRGAVIGGGAGAAGAFGFSTTNQALITGGVDPGRLAADTTLGALGGAASGAASGVIQWGIANRYTSKYSPCDKGIAGKSALGVGGDESPVSGKGGFNGDIGNGSGFGKLEGKKINVTEKGLEKVKNHIENNGFDVPENSAMIDRIEKWRKNISSRLQFLYA